MQWVMAELLGCTCRCVHAHLCTRMWAARHARRCTGTPFLSSLPVPPVLSWGSPHLPGPGPVVLSVSSTPTSRGPSSPRSSPMCGRVPLSPSVTRVMGAWSLQARPSSASRLDPAPPSTGGSSLPQPNPPQPNPPQLSRDGEGDGGKPRGWEGLEGAQLWQLARATDASPQQAAVAAPREGRRQRERGGSRGTTARGRAASAVPGTLIKSEPGQRQPN